MWDSLQNLLPKAAAKYQFRRTLDAIEVCQQFRSLVPRFIPGESLKNTIPQSYRDRVLTVSVKNSAWAQQLHMRGHLIKDEINRKFGENTVKNLKIVISDGPAPEINS